MTTQTFPRPPETDIQSIENSHVKYDVFYLLCSRWHPQRIHRYLRFTEGVLLPIEDIMAFDAQIDEDLKLAFTKMQEERKGLNTSVNLDAVMSDILMLYQKRLDDALGLEEATGEQDTATKNRQTLDRNSLVVQRAELLRKAIIDLLPHLPQLRQQLEQTATFLQVTTISRPQTLADILQEDAVEGECRPLLEDESTRD